MFFKRFPVVKFGNKHITDISTSLVVKREFVSQIDKLSDYRIGEGESPSAVSYKLYEDYDLEWILLLLNSMSNPYEDWPKDQGEIEEYVERVYGDEADEVRLYIDEDGDVVNGDVENAKPLTNREFEYLINDDKRLIKVAAPETVSRLLKQYRGLL